MVHKRTLTISDDQRQELRQYRDHDPRPQVRERCAALLKIAEGQSAHEVAHHGLLKPRDPDSVYRWLDSYEAQGLVGLLSCLHGGNRHAFR